VRHLGDYPNPEDLAFARPAALRALYHVTFPMSELWPDGRANDELVVELYEHWLEPK
jgi:nitrile hydratase subunit beta